MKRTFVVAAGFAAVAVLCLGLMAIPEGSPGIGLFGGTGEVGIAMTTLAANSLREYLLGDKNELPVIGSDIIYQGAAVGVADATGLSRPLVGGDRFSGFAEAKADNASGAASAINVNLHKRGRVQLSVSGLVITDVGQPVYATDDDTFGFSPVGGSFVGFVDRYVSAGVGIVAFDALSFQDPWGAYSTRELLSGTKTFDAEDCGKLFCVDADADGDALTLPAIAAGLSGLTILAIGAFGTTAVTIDPAAADSILGPDITAADNKDLICTKATQRRGDFVELIAGDADGYMVVKKRGTWAREA